MAATDLANRLTLTDPETATELMREALAIAEANPNTMTVVQNLALTLRQPDTLARAESLIRHNLELRLEVMGEGNPLVGDTWSSLGINLALQGRNEESLAAFDTARQEEGRKVDAWLAIRGGPWRFWCITKGGIGSRPWRVWRK